MRAEGFDDVKVMMVTTEAENDFILRALDAGADEYLMKPFDDEALTKSWPCWIWRRPERWPAGRTRILIVDDSVVMRSLLRTVVSTDAAWKWWGARRTAHPALTRD
jgi:CheY-like chemotaxis protein